MVLTWPKVCCFKLTKHFVTSYNINFCTNQEKTKEYIDIEWTILKAMDKQWKTKQFKGRMDPVPLKFG